MKNRSAFKPLCYRYDRTQRHCKKAEGQERPTKIDYVYCAPDYLAMLLDILAVG